VLLSGPPAFSHEASFSINYTGRTVDSSEKHLSGISPLSSCPSEGKKRCQEDMPIGIWVKGLAFLLPCPIRVVGHDVSERLMLPRATGLLAAKMWVRFYCVDVARF
jgi:hypothetical protein